MSDLDWNPPTPRDPNPAQQADKGGPFAWQGGVNSDAPRPLTGCLADYDALREAVRHYRQTYGRWAYEAMRDAAMRCGMPEGDPPLAWSTKRLRTFQNTMENA